MTVIYWPDGFWQYADEPIPEWRSDDYATFHASLDMSEEDIQDAIENLL